MPSNEPAQPPGRMLAERRRQLGVTQRQIADHLGITAQAVSEWERGSAQPARRYALATDELLHAGGAIAEAFGYITNPDSRVPGAELHAAVTKLGADVKDLVRRVRALEREHARSAPAQRPSRPRGSRRGGPASPPDGP